MVRFLHVRSPGLTGGRRSIRAARVVLLYGWRMDPGLIIASLYCNYLNHWQKLCERVTRFMKCSSMSCAYYVAMVLTNLWDVSVKSEDRAEDVTHHGIYWNRCTFLFCRRYIAARHHSSSLLFKSSSIMPDKPSFLASPCLSEYPVLRSFSLGQLQIHDFLPFSSIVTSLSPVINLSRTSNSRTLIDESQQRFVWLCLFIFFFRGKTPPIDDVYALMSQ